MEVGPLCSDFHSIPYSVMALLIHPDPRGRTVTLLAPRVPNSRSTLARKVGSRTKPFYRSHLTTFPYTRSSHTATGPTTTLPLPRGSYLTLPQHRSPWTLSRQARRQTLKGTLFYYEKKEKREIRVRILERVHRVSNAPLWVRGFLPTDPKTHRTGPREALEGAVRRPPWTAPYALTYLEGEES